METMGTADFEQAILKLGLVSETELAEVHDELGPSLDLQHLIAALERKSYLTPWQRGKVLKGDIDGYILGGYRLLYKIQSGSFGRVYRAEDPRDGRVVAVKVLRRRWSDNQERIDMFIREGKVGLLLKHPNIVEVLAINRDAASAQYYIVMEFVEGGNLREILQIRKKLTVAESLRIIDDCAAGLAYAYSRGMTHRDIKLTNILVSSSGEAKLVDFGLAQFFSTLARSDDEKVDRTVDYAGLERGTGVKNNDVRSDIYFLGCVLYEGLTGRSPLVMTRDKHARMRKGRFEEVQPINPREIEGPPSVLLLVETMMALDPRERYQTPSQLLEAIRAVRREADGKSGRQHRRGGTRSVFITEPDEHLQDVLRDGLKNQGYRVFLASDPFRALDRFKHQPYDGLIVDARTSGEEGFRVFQHIVEEASRKGLSCAALVLLGEDQANWATRLPDSQNIGVLVQNITYKSVSRKLKEVMEAAHGPEESVSEDAADEEDSPAAFNFSEAPSDEEAAASPMHRDSLAGSVSAPWSHPHEEDDPPYQRPEPRRHSGSVPMRHPTREPVSAPVRALDKQSWQDQIGPALSSRKKDEPERIWENFFALLGKNRKRNIILLVCVLALGLGGLLAWSLPDMITDSKYDSIETGMSESEVIDILGEGEVVGGTSQGGGQGANAPKAASAGPSIKSMKWLRGNTTIVILFSGGSVTQKTRSDKP
jgi:serine/threonine protein kinase